MEIGTLEKPQLDFTIPFGSKNQVHILYIRPSKNCYQLLEVYSSLINLILYMLDCNIMIIMPSYSQNIL